MKTLARLFALLSILASSTAWAGANDYSTVATAPVRSETALDLIRLDGSYVFSSELDNRFSPFSDDDEQDAFHASIEYSHRFLLSGKFYLRLGVGYSHFQFGETNAPVPEQLFSVSAFVGLEYMVGNDVGAFLYLRPGYYTEDHIGSSSFDMPITVGRAFVLQEDRLFFIVGANAAGLRGQFPVLPIVGLIWKPSDQWHVYLVPPDPRVTYYPTKNIGIYAGGQLVGGSFRTDEDATIFPQKLSNAQVDYTEYRVGVGVDIRCNDTFSVNVGGGYAIQRSFNFERADEEFETDPAPYVRIGLKADF